ncbi:MAG: ROK family transcriptional regulator [Pseudonocardiaceae bacterium]
MATDTPGSQSALREANLRRVLRAVRAAGSLTQVEIARSTGLSAATVSTIVRELQSSAQVVVTPTTTGRRAQSVSLSRLGGLAVGIELGQKHLRGAICDMGYRVLIEEKINYDIAQSPERGLRRAAWLVNTLLDQARVDLSQVRGVGVSVLGPLDPVAEGVRSAPLVPRWQGVDIAEELSGRVNLPVQLITDINVITDINAAALGELACGASRATADMAYIRLSTSVEAALVIRGEIYPGSSGLAGQFGHITVDESGQVCRCGNRGCLETLVGGPHLLDLLSSQPGRERPTLRGLVQAALDQDRGSRLVIGDAGRAVGAAAAILCNLLNPRQIVLGGELAQAGELLLDPIRQVLDRRTSAATERVEVRCGELGDRAVVVGALATVVRGTAVIDGVDPLLA